MSEAIVKSIAPETTASAEQGERLPVSSHWRLIRRRFVRHRLAVAGAITVVLLYLVVIFPDFLACSDPYATNAARALVPPQAIHVGSGGLYVNGLIRSRNSDTLVTQFDPDPTVRVPVRWFAHGYAYQLFGIFPTDRHLFGAAGASTEKTLF